MKSPYEYEWIVLFGGARREETIFSLAKSGVCIAYILVPHKQSDRLLNSVKKLKEAGFIIVEVFPSNLSEILSEHAGRALLSIGFPYLIPVALLDLFPFRLNIHPTLLPYYKGPTSGANIIINGEKKTGSTVHILEAEMDAGAIVAQSEVELSKFDTVRSMQKKVYRTEPQLIIEALQKIAQDEPLTLQTDHAAYIFPKRVPEDSRIDPSRSLLELYDFIRACDPDDYPAFFIMEGQKVCIKLWRSERPDEEDLESL